MTDPTQQDSLKLLAERVNLHQLFYSKALDGSYEAEAFIEACIVDGEVALREVPADEIFPLGALLANGQYGSYARYVIKNVGTDKEPSFLLLEITYLPGKITRVCWQLGPKGQKLGRLQLSVWAGTPDVPVSPQTSVTNAIGMAATPSADDTASPYVDPFGLTDETVTGIAANTITWIPNQLVRGHPVSDYDIGLPFQDALNAKQTQISRVLAKHADPKLAMPAENADSYGSAYSYDVYYFRDPAEKPSYITWDSELQHAIADRDFVLSNLLVSTETSPVLLGLKDSTIKATAFKTVKVLAMNSLKKAERKSVYWTAGNPPGTVDGAGPGMRPGPGRALRPRPDRRDAAGRASRSTTSTKRI